MGIFLYGGKLYVSVYWDLLIVGLLSVLPQLVMYIGLLALLQGYFQRSFTGRYGAAEGLLGVTLLYLLLTIFPSNIDALAVPEISAQYVLPGIIIGYLYLVSRSPYLSIGFMVALYSFWDVYYSVFQVIPWKDSFMGGPPCLRRCLYDDSGQSFDAGPDMVPVPQPLEDNRRQAQRVR
jgi:hypothetical protein